MSKIFTKTIKKTTPLTAVLTFVVAAAIALAVILGVKGYGVFNKGASLDDAKTLTISMNQYAYVTSLDVVEDLCEDVFDDLKVSYEMQGEMSGDESEIVYVFEDGANLADVEKALEEKLEELKKPDGALEGAFITVSVNSEKTVEVLAKNYALRGVIAAVVMVAAVYIYAAIRFGIGKGILAAIGTLYSMALTAAVVIFTRIPVTTSISYVFGVAGMFGAVISMLSLNKIKATEKSDETNELSAEDIATSSIACKEVAYIFCFMTAALVVLAIVAPINVKWFALSAFIGLVMTVVAGMVLVPSLYIPMKAKADMKPKAGYVGAKKTSTKEKKSFHKVKAPVAEAVVEEKTEETPVEEVVETTEEVPAEEVAEEVPAEEAAEEVVEENNDQE